MATTLSSSVKERRNRGMMAVQTIEMITPWISDSTMPCVAAVSAFSLLPAPKCSEISALIPTLKPIAMALIRFCTGYTSESAVMASSLMRATNRLSTMLYSAFTSIETTIGSAMDVNSGKTGFSFMNVSFIGSSF